MSLEASATTEAFVEGTLTASAGLTIFGSGSKAELKVGLRHTVKIGLTFITTFGYDVLQKFKLQEKRTLVRWNQGIWACSDIDTRQAKQQGSTLIRSALASKYASGNACDLDIVLKWKSSYVENGWCCVKGHAYWTECGGVTDKRLARMPQWIVVKPGDRKWEDKLHAGSFDTGAKAFLEVGYQVLVDAKQFIVGAS